jgi:membrane protein
MDAASLLKNSFITLKRNDPLILASATSFFATFSLSPVLVILINLLGVYFKNEAIRGQLLGKLEGMLGPETSEYVEGVVVNVSTANTDWLIAIAGFLFLLFVVTTLLKVVRQAMHKIWNIKRKHVSRLKYNFKERSMAVAVILVTGVLVAISALMDTSLALLRNYLSDTLPTTQIFLVRSLNLLFSLIVSTMWFSVLFKILPDAKVHWRVAFAGGVVTAVLFSAGKWILGKLLLYNTIANIFGPSASFVLILLFIFYSSLILYFGAAFTFNFASAIGMPIHAGKYSETYEVRSIEDDDDNPSSEKEDDPRVEP